MKAFKLNVDIYVYADSATEAEELIADELKYACKLDNQLIGFDFMVNTAEETEE